MHFYSQLINSEINCSFVVDYLKLEPIRIAQFAFQTVGLSRIINAANFLPANQS